MVSYIREAAVQRVKTMKIISRHIVRPGRRAGRRL